MPETDLTISIWPRYSGLNKVRINRCAVQLVKLHGAKLGRQIDRRSHLFKVTGRAPAGPLKLCGDLLLDVPNRHGLATKGPPDQLDRRQAKTEQD